jgi:hypothetical protein
MVSIEIPFTEHEECYMLVRCSDNSSNDWQKDRREQVDSNPSDSNIAYDAGGSSLAGGIDPGHYPVYNYKCPTDGCTQTKPSFTENDDTVICDVHKCKMISVK